MRNTFGNLFTLTTFGESHGIAVGGVIDGFPAGIEIDMDFIQSELNRRRPGQSHITTARKEADKVEFLSGVFEGKSTGTPIGFEVRNQNQHSQDYENMRCLFRPSHADFTYHEKYGVRDHRGGGRSSARITIARCVGGALAKLALRQLGISITAYTSQVGSIALEKDYHLYDLNTIEDNPVRCPDQTKAKEMEHLIAQVKADGDTIGAVFLRGIYSDSFAALDNGEHVHLVRFPDGTQIRYDDEAHALAVTIADGGTVEVTASGGVTVSAQDGVTINADTTTINGDVQVNGKITASDDVVGGGISLMTHTHSGVQSGGAMTGPPA